MIFYPAVDFPNNKTGHAQKEKKCGKSADQAIDDHDNYNAYIHK